LIVSLLDGVLTNHPNRRKVFHWNITKRSKREKKNKKKKTIEQKQINTKNKTVRNNLFLRHNEEEKHKFASWELVSWEIRQKTKSILNLIRFVFLTSLSLSLLLFFSSPLLKKTFQTLTLSSHYI